MKKIKLTQGKVALVDDEDYNKLNQFNWYAHNGWGDNFYAVRNVWLAKNKRKTERMHNVIFGKTTEGNTVDHIDRNGLNNQKENLRECTKSENSLNTDIYKSNTSGFRGVSWDKVTKKWKVQRSFNKKQQYLGVFSTKIEAYRIYFGKT